MPKINIKVTINNLEENTSYEVPAIITEEIIKYKEPNYTMVTYNFKDNSLFRENDELRMEYYFNSEKKTKGSINIKELNKKIDLEIKTKKIERKNNNIEIEFIIDSNIFLYKIEEIK